MIGIFGFGVDKRYNFVVCYLYNLNKGGLKMADVTLVTAEEIRDRMKILAVNLKKTIRDLTDMALLDFLKKNEG